MNGVHAIELEYCKRPLLPQSQPHDAARLECQHALHRAVQVSSGMVSVAACIQVTHGSEGGRV